MYTRTRFNENFGAPGCYVSEYRIDLILGKAKAEGGGRGGGGGGEGGGGERVAYCHIWAIHGRVRFQ